MNQHMICGGCFLDLIVKSYHNDATLKGMKCPWCPNTVEPVEPFLFDEHVFIYVDDSNMWIEAKKLAAKRLNLKCVEDPRLRLDIGRVADVVANGREVAWGVLYGSEPPPIDTVWEKIRERGWKVITSKRSRFTNKEKQVDHKMVTDITALVSDRGVAKGRIVIVSGDADVIPAIKEGLAQNWSFEICMWESGISKALKDLAEENPELLTIFPLDSHLQDISFTNYKIGANQILKPEMNLRSAVIKDAEFTPDDAWQKNLSETLGWPFQFCLIGPEKLGSPLDFKDIFLLFASKMKSIDDKDFTYHFEKIFQRLEQEYPGSVVNFPAYRKKYCVLKEGICLTNRFGTLEDFDEELSSSSRESDVGEAEAQNQPELDRSEWATEDGEDDCEKFQVVKRQTQRRSQQYSEQCKYRSKCVNKLKCTHGHTDDEKKFFKYHLKHVACKFGKSCWNYPGCQFTHSGKDSFCGACHHWGHLQDRCLSKLPS